MTLAIVDSPAVAQPAPQGTAYQFRVHLRRPSDGREFPGDVVSDAYLEVVRQQVLFAARRKGLLEAEGSEGAEGLTIQPLFAEGERDRACGLEFIVRAGGQMLRQQFGLEVFEAAAQSELERLIKGNQLKSDAKAVYRVSAQIVPATSTVTPDGPRVVSQVRRKSLPLLPGRLSEWLEAAEPRGPVADEDFPLFILESALERSREYCYQPDRREAGAMLVGHLYRQIEPHPEIFAVADAAIQLRHAQHERFSLNLTPETFTDLGRQLELRRTRLGRTHEVPLVLAHSHDFLPSLAEDGEANCTRCPLRPSCKLTSSFYSAGDVRFHTALFGRQPWVAGMVLGLTPREEPDVRLFCLAGTRSRERGYYVIRQKPELNHLEERETDAQPS